MIYYKSPDEIEVMAEGGRILTRISRDIKEMVQPGISTKDIDERAVVLFKKNGMEPAFLNYGRPPYPATVCTSINHEVVHGIPSVKRKVNEGDIVSIDIGGIYRGFCADMAFTATAGEVSLKVKELINSTREALNAGINKMIAGNRLYDISAAIQGVAEKKGYSLVRDLVGHGIGKNLHEAPQVPNFGKSGTGPVLKEGLVIAIEPMVNVGGYGIVTADDQWTISTADGKLSCHWEKTVALTGDGPRVLAGL
ncbi:MAG: type I methionyl aminopeptidase [Elusimicrobia bacterium]|jgi:methionyl aminopeptidase|nr:type I methionyl aminopeptidase [Elusimicrobiota bacterium]